MEPTLYRANTSNGALFFRSYLFVVGLLLLFFGSLTQASAQTATIPDANFRQFLVQTFPQAMNANQELIIAEAAKIDTLDCYNNRIKDLTGVQYFTGLRTLRCYHNELSSLPDISGLTNLWELTIDFNEFTTLPDVSKNVSLRYIYANRNQLSSLPDLSPLTHLYLLRLGQNQFTTFPAAAIASNVNLGDLNFQENQLTSLPDLSHFKFLNSLIVDANQLTALPDLSQLTYLSGLSCSNNLLSTLPDLSNNLELRFLDISANMLTAFPDISANTKLVSIHSTANSIGSLPDLSNHLELTSLDCQGNGLTALPDLSNNTKLEHLHCSGNYLTELPDLSNNTKLYFLTCRNNQLTALPDLSNTAITMIDFENNQVSSLPPLSSTAPLLTFLSEGNKLTFEDILPLLPFRSDAFVKTAVQQSVGTRATVRLNTGDSYTIDLNIDHAITDNVYQWYKRSGRTSTLVATTAENKLTLASITPADTGTYMCIVTNPRMSPQALQLQSFPVKIQTEQPWLPVTSGGDNHVLVIPSNITSNINGSPIAVGDYIGLFFADSNGALVNGGMAKWTGNHLTLNAWSSTSTPKNGFLANEAFTLKVWRASERKEYTVNATYNTTAPYTHGGAFAPNGFSSINALGTPPVCVNQVISLYAGWNLISINVQPGDLAMRTIFAGMQNILVKDAAGRILYAPQNGITSGVWNIREGYKVLVPTNQTLTLCGTRIDPRTTIAIPHTTYPYFLPYFASVTMPVTSALNGLGTNFNFAQSNEYRNGSTVVNAYNYLPAHVINPPIDQIGMMRPGLAYKVSVTNPVPAFGYPTLTGARLKGDNQLTDLSLSHYSLLASTTGNNALLIIPQGAFGPAIAEGDEVAVYTSQGTLAGAAKYTNENMVITIWENQQMQPGESYQLKVWKQDSQQELVAQVSYQQGNGQYAANSVQKVSTARLMTADAAVTTQQVVAYPNPAQGFIRFRAAAHQTGAVTVSLHDLMGAKVLEVSQASLKEVTLAVDQLPAGQYVCVVKVNGQELRSKIAVVK